MAAPLSRYREVHLEVGGVLVFEHTIPLVDDLVGAIVVSWETDEDHLSSVVVGRYVGDDLAALVLAPLCTECQGVPPALFGVVGTDLAALCAGCAPQVTVSFREYETLTGLPLEFYDTSLLSEARIRYQAHWGAEDLEYELQRAADLRAFLDPLERPRWVSERAGNPGTLLALVGALLESGDLLGYQAQLREVLEPHRETFRVFEGLPDLHDSEALGVVLALLFG